MKRAIITILAAYGIAALSCTAAYLARALYYYLAGRAFDFHWPDIFDPVWIAFAASLLSFLVIYLQEVKEGSKEVTK